MAKPISKNKTFHTVHRETGVKIKKESFETSDLDITRVLFE